MSTRAIIGILNEDNSVYGLWQWNDGEGLLPLLQENFKTIEDTCSLIGLGMINLMCTEEEAVDLDNWKAEHKIKIEGEWYKYHNAMIFKSHTYFGREPTTYKNMEDALGQDINYLYLYDPKTQAWSVHS